MKATGIKSMSIHLDWIEPPARWYVKVKINDETWITYAGKASFTAALDSAVEDLPRAIAEAFMGTEP